MGHHINEAGEFQSDKHSDLPPDRIRLNLKNPRSTMALTVLAADYLEKDPELAADLLARLEMLFGPSLDQVSYAYAMGLLEVCAQDFRHRRVLEPALRLLGILSGVKVDRDDA